MWMNPLLHKGFKGVGPTSIWPGLMTATLSQHP
jgi:hypothetical protein